MRTGDRYDQPAGIDLAVGGDAAIAVRRESVLSSSGANAPSSPSWPERTPFLRDEAPFIQVQSVLYNTAFAELRRSVESLVRAAEISMSETGSVRAVTLAVGDSSPLPCLEDADVADLKLLCEPYVFLTYTWFAANLGSARGHNTLAEGTEADFIFLTNPDIVMSPRTLDFLLDPFRKTAVGMTEAKQLPLEHPKAFEPVTGETSWASGACSLVPAVVFRELQGYDADSFFMYCDDVDLSWRVRLLGLRVVHQPAATVFHDKRVGSDLAVPPSQAEKYYSAEAALILAHKWSRPDLVESILSEFDAHGQGYHKAAATAFRDRRKHKRLPTPVDPGHDVGQFIAGHYAEHRF